MFGTATNNQSPFGATSGATTGFGATATGPSLFGASTQQTNTTPMFGNASASATNASVPAFSFGANTPQQPHTSNLFGASTNNNTGSMFGSGTQTSTAAFQFGKPATVAPAGSGINLFSNPTNASSTNMFSNPGQTNNPLGSSMFGNTKQPQQLQQQQQPQPQQPQITALTRPSDLSEEAQKEIDQINDYITKEIGISDDLKARKDTMEESIQSVPRDVEVLIRKVATAHQALINDNAAMNSHAGNVQITITDAQTCFKLAQQLRVPGSRLPSNDALLGYFERHATELERKINDYKTVLNDVDRAVDGLEREIVVGQVEGGSAEATLTALKGEYAVFMALGNRVAELHHSVARLESREK
ncbi:hypothetical protein V1512DRAFT_249157 [Lipomyces arxii]|uniref:uncharacterized protein n=1 Tax=Lipomyces arxii TaxID=56418 RepID=UPI0034CD54B5